MTEPIAAPTGTPNLNKALAAFQADMPTIERDRVVEVETKGDKPNYGYSYATLANVTRVAMPLLGKHGLSFTAFPGAGSDGKGMSLRYALLHESGEERTGEFPLSAEGGIQVLGGRITYSRRYCLLAVTGIAADEDDDAAAAQAEDDANAGTAQRRPRQAANNAATPRRQKLREQHAAERSDSAAVVDPTSTTAQRAERTGPPLPNEDGPVRGRGGLITEPMTRKLAITMKQALGDNPDDRRQYIVDMIGREVATSKDLTFDEGRGLIDAFEKANQDPDTAAATVIDIYRRVNQAGGPAASAPAARQPGRSRNAAEAIGTGGMGDEQAPWEDEGLPV